MASVELMKPSGMCRHRATSMVHARSQPFVGNRRRALRVGHTRSHRPKQVYVTVACKHHNAIIQQFWRYDSVWLSLLAPYSLFPRSLIPPPRRPSGEHVPSTGGQEPRVRPRSVVPCSVSGHASSLSGSALGANVPPPRRGGCFAGRLAHAPRTHTIILPLASCLPQGSPRWSEAER